MCVCVYVKAEKEGGRENARRSGSCALLPCCLDSSSSSPPSSFLGLVLFFWFFLWASLESWLLFLLLLFWLQWGGQERPLGVLFFHHLPGKTPGSDRGGGEQGCLSWEPCFFQILLGFVAEQNNGLVDYCML